MTANAPLTLNDAHSQRLWEAINRIPDDVLRDYLADQVIDEAEIEDITHRLETICQSHSAGLSISEADHALIRRMVQRAVQHIALQRETAPIIEGALNPTTLGDIRAAMGHLIQSGQIALGVADPDYGDTPDPGSYIPDERPEGYDEDAPNLLEE